MNLYEGMYIFPETMDEDAIDNATKAAIQEIEKLGGNLKSTARLGKRKFARRMEKNDFGYYVVMTFELDPKNVQSLKKRYKLMEDLLRVQIVRTQEEESGPEQQTEMTTKEKEDG